MLIKVVIGDRECPEATRTFNARRLFIGRGPNNDIDIDSRSVSRSNTLIEVRDDQSMIATDLGSVNGTYVNGKRIREPTRLTPDDVLALGGTKLWVSCSESLVQTLAALTLPDPTEHVPLISHVTVVSSVQADVMVRGGRVIDPANGRDGNYDVLIGGGRIVAIASDMPVPSGCRVIDADNRIVVPALVDFDVRCYHGFTTAGVDPERIAEGAMVGHINDIGSAGLLTLRGFCSSIARDVPIGTTCFVHILGLGNPEQWTDLCAPGESPAIVPERLIEAVHDNRTVVRGLTCSAERATAARDSSQQLTAARAVASAARIPLHVDLGRRTQHSDAMLPFVLELARPDDLLGSVASQASPLHRPDGTLHPIARELADRGNRFVASGADLCFATARRLLDAGLEIDIVASGTRASTTGDDPSQALLATMTRVLALGVPLVDVVRAATATPAASLGLPSARGIVVGEPAELSVLALRSVYMTTTDGAGESLRIERALAPVCAVRAGKLHLPAVRGRREPTSLEGMRL